VIPAFFLMLREGLEASLIVGIIAAYLVKLGRSDALPKVAVGVLAAVGASVAVGAGAALAIVELPEGAEELLAGLAGVAAVVVLTWMLFWMRRQGRAMKSELEGDVQAALAVGSTSALVGLAFIAVVREGLETALFLFAIGSTQDDVVAVLIGSIAGLAGAVAIGWMIFRMGVRVDLRRFFTVTGVILIFVSAGLCAFAVHELTEVGLLPETAVLWDLGSVLPESSPVGTLLAGLFGYRSAPTVLEAIAYVGYLVPVLALFLFGGRKPRTVNATPTPA